MQLNTVLFLSAIDIWSGVNSALKKKSFTLKYLVNPDVKVSFNGTPSPATIVKKKLINKCFLSMPVLWLVSQPAHWPRISWELEILFNWSLTLARAGIYKFTTEMSTFPGHWEMLLFFLLIAAFGITLLYQYLFLFFQYNLLLQCTITCPLASL